MLGESRHRSIPDLDSARRDQTRLLLLIDTGLLLGSERSLPVVVQAALDAGRQLCDAAYGTFLYNIPGENGETYHFSTTSGLGTGPAPAEGAEANVPLSLFAGAPDLAGARAFTGVPVLFPEAIVRSGDLSDPAAGYLAGNPVSDPAADPGKGATDTPLRQQLASLLSPPGQAPARSCLAIPVRSRGGDVLGAMVYGHPAPEAFASEVEPLMAAIAVQAAAAIENARLTTSLHREMLDAERARAEQRAADRRLSQTLDAAQLGTWRWNANTDLLDFDERGAKLLSVPARCPLQDSLLREQLAACGNKGPGIDALLQAFRSPEKHTSEHRLHGGAGDLRWIALTGTPVEATRGEPGSIIGTLQDVTARRAQEAALRTSEKLAATGRLAATIAHEINNPLEAVTNLIYLAKTDPELPSSIQHLLETADQELARVSQIAQQTLGFYRDTAQPVTIDLNELLTAVVDLFSRKLSGKQIHCKLDLEPHLRIHGLRGEIRQVVSNLLVNAIDASRSSGRIHIRGRRRGSGIDRGVCVLISDSGDGISEELGSKLFHPFVTSKQSSGTGLGLWVTRGIVEKHGGSVRFRSRTLHPSGTVFRVYLPEVGGAHISSSPSQGILQ